MAARTPSPVREPPAASREPAWLRDLRVRALDLYRTMQWPTPTEEEWRRTDLSRFDLSRFPEAAPGQGPAASARRSAHPKGSRSAPPEGFAGSISARDGGVSLSGRAEEQGVRLLDLSEAADELEEPLAGLFEAALREADNRFIPWHLSQLRQGAVLFVPPQADVTEPFLLDFTAADADTLLSPHVVVILGRGARASVVQRSTGPASAEALWNAACDLCVEDGASLTFHEVQELGERTLLFRHTRAVVGRDGRLSHFDASFGGRLVKTRVDCLLNGSGADAQLRGVYFARHGQHMDIRTVQRHAAPSAASRGFYKGAVKDDGRAIFQGLIEVSPGASRTDAFLTNRNLVLNDGARSDSIPSLKIGNNDVKCSHGSTTGRIDQDQLFYLRSRGLSYAEAREMLVTGYFEELAGETPEAFRSRVLAAVRERLSGPEEPR